MSCSSSRLWRCVCREDAFSRWLTLQDYGYNVTELNGLLITLFERYSELLRRKFSSDFDQASHGPYWSGRVLILQIVQEDDNQPMMVNDAEEFEQVAGVCWLAMGEKESLAMSV